MPDWIVKWVFKPGPDDLVLTAIVSSSSLLLLGLIADFWIRSSDIDPMFLFQRSGALLVCIGIYVAWRDFSGRLDEAMLHLASQPSGIGADTTKVVLQEAKNRLRNTEAGILISGTLVWAFGDILFLA